jgi:hypothetical protein
LFDITPASEVDLNEKEEDEGMPDSSSSSYYYYYYYHPQRDLLALDCALYCNATRPVVDVDGFDFRSLIDNCINLPSACPTEYNVTINCWNTSKVNDMSNAFKDQNLFNDSIECWDTSQVNIMYNMFYCSETFNQHVGDWNVSQVNDMTGVFDSAYSFNQSIENVCYVFYCIFF